MIQIIIQYFDNNQLSFNILHSIFFKITAALFTSFFITLLSGNKFINYLLSMQKNGQPIRIDGPSHHVITKKGTPCMGGLLIIVSIITSTFLWANIKNSYILLLSFVVISFGLIGIIDDSKKLKKGNCQGLSTKYKFLLQCFLSIICVLLITYINYHNRLTNLVLPFIKNQILDLGNFYFIFGIFVITGSSNAVNLTDGLDGLAIGTIIISSIFLIIVAYLSSNIITARYLKLIYIQNASEIMIFCAAIIGSSLGFLWYNAPPAKVFMGDTGSLALGAAIGVISIIIKNELLLLLIGIVFVFETISVVLQVGSFKLTGKRIFKMAPIHHHFEKIGWSEATIVIRFWIITVIFGFVGIYSIYS